MGTGWAHLGAAITASFMASLVECVEALTVVLAVGSLRGWRSALAGSGMAIALLTLLIVFIGHALLRIPLRAVQLAVGVLTVMFGLRWLRKAILRAAGLIPLHDETAAFIKKSAELQTIRSKEGTWDRIAFGTSFNITMLEGTEVVFIVIAIGAGGKGMLLPAGMGAIGALLLVIVLGFVLHRPLAKVPENTLKFVVGVLLSGFGTFWLGEGMGIGWPGCDWSILGLMASYLVLALACVPLCRRQSFETI